jgi:hypothetical protein
MIAIAVASDWPTSEVRIQKNQPMFELATRKRGRTRWEWRVCDSTGRAIMNGWETSHLAARYRAERALFLLLLAPNRETPAPSNGQRARTRLPPF